MREPRPVETLDLLPRVHNALLGLLSNLSSEEWELPTPCPGWTVKDIAAHLLAVDLLQLSGSRDGYSPQRRPVREWDELVSTVNNDNEQWVRAARVLSPTVLQGFLSRSGSEVYEHFNTLDMSAPSDVVRWASDTPAPAWLHIAREYTERWHHQQQIREAAARPGLTECTFLRPVLETFVRALPRAYRETDAKDGTNVKFTIIGESGGEWSVVLQNGFWGLYVRVAASPDAHVRIDEHDAWALFTKSADRNTLIRDSDISGDPQLAAKIFDAVAIIG